MWEWLRWWRLPAADDEARECLHDLEERDEQVQRLHRELSERQRVNNFSGLVAQAIARASHEGR